jgi:uncharacterized protein YbjT (DUF2867 family)
MKVLVTGASGFLGEAVLREIQAEKQAIRVLARHPDAARAQSLAHEFGVEIRPGDLMSGPNLAAALEGLEAVVHLVGIISEFGQATFENVHVQGTRNLVLAMQAAEVKRLVHVSALGTRAHAASRYHQTKWAAEESVRESGLEYTIFRPSIIYGPHDRFVNLFAKLSRFSPILPVMGPGKAKLQPIGVQSVARAVMKALSEPRSIGRTFDLCGTETFTFIEVLDQILQVTGRRRWKWHLPLWSARILAGCLEWLFPVVLRRPAPLNRDQLIMLQEDNVGDPQPAMELFELPTISFGDGIRRYLLKVED